ncbi:MAG: hypothetical protein MRJ68_10885 [Nitrospira sp.]|nr:hypothetical protein [Nitrospira sp.]
MSTRMWVLMGFCMAMLIGATNDGLAGDACKKVTFKVKNSHNSGEKILIKKVKYFNKANGKWQTEVVNQYLYNTTGEEGSPTLNLVPFATKDGLECSHGYICETAGDNLRDAEGEDLTKIRFVYQYWAAGVWSGELESKEFEPVNPTCTAGKTYSGGKNVWAIQGTK